MRYFQDTGLLILYSLLALLFTEINLPLVLGFLCAVILSNGCYVLESVGLRLISICVFLLFSIFCPACYLFFPVVFYLLGKNFSYRGFFLGGSFFLYHYYIGRTSSDPASIPVLFVLFGLLLAWLLCRNAVLEEQLQNTLRNIQDDSREHNLLLSEKNKMLLEKQDYEIYTATLKERNRIAREIHDNVGHVLSRSILMVGAGKAMNQDKNLRPLLNNLDLSLNTAMDSIRNSVHDLHDESVHLKEVTDHLIEDFTLCPVEFQYDMGFEISKELKYCFISITKEALSNIMKHSNATKVLIRMQEHPALYQLCIKDNGTVQSSLFSQKTELIENSAQFFSRSGMGLMNMKDRVRALNGNFQISTKNGFQIFVTIPK